MAETGSTRSVTAGQASTIGRPPESFYPSPFFDVAQNYMPKNIKDTFAWCSYYQQTNPIIHAVTNKLATYPITDLIYDDENGELVARYKRVLEQTLLLRSFLIEANLDRYTYGNALISVVFPFKKMLVCPSCKKEVAAKRSGYKWKGFNFHLTCTCGFSGAMKAKDAPVKNETAIRLVKWHPKNVTLKFNEITGKALFYYEMPRYIRNDITLGKPGILEDTPQAFIDAIRDKKAIVLDNNMLFHMKRPSISRDAADTGLGLPIMLPVLKDAFFIQVLKKSQEMVAMEHIVPMRVLFPQVTTDGNNPYANINLTDWQKEAQDQIKKWKADNNYIPVMPVPLGYQMIGGQGKSYLLHQEIRIYSEQLIAGMGVPVGFFYGEAQYSGASVNLRALENEFMGNRQDMLRLVEFIRDKIAAFLDLPKIKLTFKPFKMADDIQRATMSLNMVGQGLISRHTFLQSQEFNHESEQELIKIEAEELSKRNREAMLRQAETNGEVSLITAKYQAKTQALMAALAPQQPAIDPATGQPVQTTEQEVPVEEQPQQPQQGVVQGIEQSPAGATSSVDLFAQAKKAASDLKKMDDTDRYAALAELKKYNPDLYNIINEYMGRA